MNHFITLPENEYNNIKTPLLTNDSTTFAEGDTLTITMEGHRDQKVFTITSIARERVFKGWCYLGLGGQDDIAGNL